METMNMAGGNHILLYQTADGETRLEVLYQDESLWLSQRDMAALFQKDVSSINRHIKNVYEERELNPDSTIAFFAIVQNEGGRRVSREIAHYNLDMIISVGYRVKKSYPKKSSRGACETQEKSCYRPRANRRKQ